MQFGKLPKAVMQAPVSMGAKVLYGALAMYRNSRTLQCNPSHTQLAETIGVSATHINTLANELNRAGLIQRAITPGRQTCYLLPHLSAEFDASTPAQEPWGRLPKNPWGVDPQTTQESLGALPKNPGVDYPRTLGGSLIKVSKQTIEQTTEQTSLKRRKQPVSAAPYQPSAESLKALELWEACAPLPHTANRLHCLKVLDDLHRLDGLSWDRIHRICRHAAREWVPAGYIASPAKLRKPTRSGELKTWEAIERQLKGPVLAQPAPLNIMPNRSW